MRKGFAIFMVLAMLVCVMAGCTKMKTFEIGKDPQGSASSQESKKEESSETAPADSSEAPAAEESVEETAEEAVEEDDGYERNAAGGYTYTYRNENLDMTISISEFNWSSAVPMEMSKEDFVQDNFDYYTAYPNEESQINDDYFYIITKEDKGNNDYFKEIVGDVFCTDIHVIYPADNSECESIKDDFLKSYVKNK